MIICEGLKRYVIHDKGRNFFIIVKNKTLLGRNPVCRKINVVIGERFRKYSFKLFHLF